MAHTRKTMKAAGGGARPNSEINVTPLVDVVLVLLIIFMVVTPLLEKDIEVRLPEEQEDEAPVPPDQQSQIVVQINAAGDLAINTERVNLDDYETRLKRALSAKPKGERLVFFLPEEKANYGVVVKALDQAKSAGAEILGMVTTDLAAQQAAMPMPDGTGAGMPPTSP